ncbi:MAG: DUF1998 domain-containing protein [Polyangiales bacterium]
MSTTKKSSETKAGELRMSGAMLGAGPGALLDLTDTSVMVAGLDEWGNPLKVAYGLMPRFTEVHDARLQGYVRSALDARDTVRLFHPEPAEDEEGIPSPNGIRAWEFPEWFVTQEYDDPRRSRGGVRSRPLVHRKSLGKDGKLVVEVVDPKTGREVPRKVSVVPVRFVRACIQGHIEDIDWEGYAHPGRERCGTPKSLRLEERGTSGDLAELYVVCTACEGAEQSMARATEIDKVKGCSALGWCRGRELWKGRHARVDCRVGSKPVPSKLLVRSATNAWFPAQLSAITLPPSDATKSEAYKLVVALWDDVFNGVEEVADLKPFRKNQKYKEQLAGFEDAELVTECQRKRAEDEAPPPDPTAKAPGPKVAELDALLAVDGHAGVDEPGSLFYAERIDPPARRGGGTRPLIDRVVLVHRLREVRALVGFTRFEALVAQLDGELDLGVGVAPLASHRQWVPAVENYGEGVFLSLDPQRVDDWTRELPVEDRSRQLRRGFERWQRERGNDRAVYLPMSYVLVHSLAHLLITAVSLECGYPSSSIRERVYSSAGRHGVLLYTASPDAEGTLGGLVATGRQLERHLQAALEIGRLCSNDPVCANHDPDSVSGELCLQGAACHGCLLISETSCERQNTWLDRAAVVPTVAHGDVAFFRGW